MLDSIQEILTTLRQNKLRTLMTGFSVAWGIFMLIILLGSGKGLQNGTENNYSGVSKNAIWIWSRSTQVAYDGLQAGRRIQFEDKDLDDIVRYFGDDLDFYSGRFSIGGNGQVTYGTEFRDYYVEGISPSFKNIRISDQLEGRFINDFDIIKNRKVVVISKPVKEALFQDDEEALGKRIRISSVPFKVVGIIENPENRNRDYVYIPLSTAKIVFDGENKLSEMAIATNSNSVEKNKQIEDDVRVLLMKNHRVSPEDKRAIGSWNTLEGFQQAQGVFSGIRIFVWVIGIMTIIAGIVGVSNIMFILVKERTKEIGIRKAIGATPWSIIHMVISESIFITGVAGFLGLVVGMLTLSGINSILESIGGDVEKTFWNPSASLSVALWALLILVVAGVIAGFIPAQKAASIRPIDALHDE